MCKSPIAAYRAFGECSALQRTADVFEGGNRDDDAEDDTGDLDAVSLGIGQGGFGISRESSVGLLHEHQASCSGSAEGATKVFEMLHG